MGTTTNKTYLIILTLLVQKGHKTVIAKSPKIYQLLPATTTLNKATEMERQINTKKSKLVYLA